MARPEMERTVTQSVLDRLMDDDPRAGGDATLTWGESVRRLKISLRRDLEWLLNTRRIPVPVPEACEELEHSLFTFGLPDITSLHRDAPDTRSRLAREVEEAIRVFEPRLTGARVTVVEEDDGSATRYHFVVEALLRLDPSPERVVFDTVLDVPTGEFDIGPTKE